MNRQQQTWLIFISFLVAFALSILPLPTWLAPYRPDWISLMLIYWCLVLPERVGVVTGWSLGLLLDILLGSLIGQRALSLSIVAYASVKLHQRTRLYPMWQQALTVLLMLLLNQLFILWISGIIGRPPKTPFYWAPSFVGFFLWPWLFYFMNAVQQQTRSE